MSTNSTIAIQKEDGTVDIVYCHSSGQLNGTGKTLFETYSDDGRAEFLVGQGKLSSVVNGINAYKDRGEPWSQCKPDNHKDIETYLKWGLTGFYNYIYRNGAWYLAESGGFMKLSQFVVNE